MTLHPYATHQSLNCGLNMIFQITIRTMHSQNIISAKSYYMRSLFEGWSCREVVLFPLCKSRHSSISKIDIMRINCLENNSTLLLPYLFPCYHYYYYYYYSLPPTTFPTTTSKTLLHHYHYYYHHYYHHYYYHYHHHYYYHHHHYIY